MNVEIINERNEMIKDLEKTFTMALEAGDYKAAIQAKHMIGKMRGYFPNKKLNKHGISLVELSQEELEMLICEAEDISKWENINSANLSKK